VGLILAVVGENLWFFFPFLFFYFFLACRFCLIIVVFIFVPGESTIVFLPSCALAMLNGSFFSSKVAIPLDQQSRFAVEILYYGL
tara:strand:- start:48 stop:302 length:255 start_codon:yes stop_codon:yes gene_type:complete